MSDNIDLKKIPRHTFIVQIDGKGDDGFSLVVTRKVVELLGVGGSRAEMRHNVQGIGFIGSSPHPQLRPKKGPELSSLECHMQNVSFLNLNTNGSCLDRHFAAARHNRVALFFSGGLQDQFGRRRAISLAGCRRIAIAVTVDHQVVPSNPRTAKAGRIIVGIGSRTRFRNGLPMLVPLFHFGIGHDRIDNGLLEIGTVKGYGFKDFPSIKGSVVAIKVGEGFDIGTSIAESGEFPDIFAQPEFGRDHFPIAVGVKGGMKNGGRIWMVPSNGKSSRQKVATTSDSSCSANKE